jgi:hypothetical protein
MFAVKHTHVSKTVHNFQDSYNAGTSIYYSTDEEEISQITYQMLWIVKIMIKICIHMLGREQLATICKNTISRFGN